MVSKYHYHGTFCILRYLDGQAPRKCLLMPPTSSIFCFSGHETFPFRYSWLKKGVDSVAKDPAFFTTERAMIDLGVGKNMVNSIRHWCLAARLIEQVRGSTSRGQFIPTEIGERVFFDGR